MGENNLVKSGCLDLMLLEVRDLELRTPLLLQLLNVWLGMKIL